MKSKIINMADKIKDAQDKLLESLFQTEAIADNGFSDRIVGKIRRRLLVRRFSLPIAVVIGASVSVKPLAGLVEALFSLLAAAPASLVAVPTDWLPPVYQIVMGGMLLVVAVLSVRMLEE